MNTSEQSALTKKDRRAIKTLTRRADFLDGRVAKRGKQKDGTDLDSQEAASLRHLLARVYGQNADVDARIPAPQMPESITD